MAHLQKSQAWQVNDGTGLQPIFRLPIARKTEVRYAANGFKSTLMQKIRHIANINQFVDVGANLGQTMLEVFSDNQEVEYFGFEPNPQAFSCLQELASAIPINAHLFPWACGVKSSPASFYSSSIEDCSATLLPEIRPDTYSGCNPTHIASYPLDISLLNSTLTSCFTMKIDVEGFENEVLSGAKNLLTEKRPFIFCEVLHAHRNSEIGLNNARKTLLESFLNVNDYSIFQIHLDPTDRSTYRGLTQINALPKNILWRSGPHTCDFFFVPRECEKPVIASI